MENTWAQNAYLIDDSILTEFSGSEKQIEAGWRPFLEALRSPLGPFGLGVMASPK